MNDKTPKKHIHRAAIADDGLAINPDLLRRYSMLGFSTGSMSKTVVGKFGVGKKLSALTMADQVPRNFIRCFNWSVSTDQKAVDAKNQRK